MSEDLSRRRYFNEKEISTILKRASEMQHTDGSSDTYGLSTSELERLASEVGIDPRFITAAIVELEQGLKGDQETNFWGGPLLFDQERVIEGEMNEETWEMMVSEIRKVLKDTGKVNEWGHSLEWIHSGSSGEQATITVTPRDGKVKIHVFRQFSVVAAAAYAPIMILGFILGGVSIAVFSPSIMPGLGLYFGILCTMFFLARWTLQKMARKEIENEKHLLRRLEKIVVEQGPLQETNQNISGAENTIHSE